MDKKRVFAILWLCLGIAGVASAVEVISIDINHYDPNAPAYSGEAAVAGATEWISYCGGWGVAVGSPRSADLISYSAATQASTYAKQVWIGDPGNHYYVQGAGSDLLDDGFRKNSTEPNDPSITLFGGQGAYGGIFDMYVYGDEEGYFSVKKQDSNDLDTKYISGEFTTGTFVEGGNYVVFENLSIGDPNQIQLFYTNRLSGIQLVSEKEPVAVADGTIIDARNYDVAYDTNGRSGESTLYGPDLGSYVHYLDTGEYMIYDITVSAANKGKYSIYADVVTLYDSASMTLYLDGRSLGTLTASQTSTSTATATNAISVNLLEGSHTVEWYLPTIKYFDMVDLKFTRTSDIVMSDCAEISTYGLNYAGDITGDCAVDMDDLMLLAADWANCYNPESGACD